jgi:NitT/TauT family transport system ATP-binding protein
MQILTRKTIMPSAKAPAAQGSVLLQVDGVSLQYAERASIVTATWRVSFNVQHGDRFILLGPSGCGKSSLLKAVAGFVRPVEGRMTLQGVPISRPGPDRMMVFQEFDQLFPWRTVIQNVMFPMQVRHWTRRDRMERARESLERVGLSKFADAYPHTLSGGMKQRAAIARAMALEPDVLLMDEPFAALDALTRRRLQDELLHLWDDLRFTMLFVTHAIDEATRVGSRILLLSPHPGQVRAEFGCNADWDPAQRQALEQRITAMLMEESQAHRTGVRA